MQDKCELEGVHLDAEVARLEGKDAIGFSPSTSWAIGGPIIEREKIELIYYGEMGYMGLPWEAQIGCDTHYIDQSPGDATGGRTPLIAAMRAYVESKRHNVK